MSGSLHLDIKHTLFPRWILLVDPEITGHHGTYLRLLSLSFQRLGYHVCILCGERPPWLRINKAGDTRKMRYMRISEFSFRVLRPKRLRMVVRGFFRWAVLIVSVIRVRQLLRGTIDLIFLSYLDGYLIPSVFHFSQGLLPACWSGLYVSPIEGLPNKRRRYVPISRILAKRKCVGILTLVRTVANKYKQTSGKFVWLPDISDNSVDYKQYTSVEAIKPFHDRIVVGLVGAIARRKAVIQLVQAAELAHRARLSIAFVIAGHFERASFSCNDLLYLKDTRNILPNIVWWPHFIQEETEFNAIVRSCDVLFAAYPDFYMSSNMLAKSAAFGKRIIALRDTYVGTLTEEYDLGVTLPVITPEGILEAILKARAVESDFQRKAKRSRFQQLHSEAAFDRALSSIVNTSDCELKA